MVRYVPSSKVDSIASFASEHLKKNVVEIERLASMFRGLTTDQSEIIATLYACWNDFLIRNRKPTDDEIISEFLLSWHDRKKRFSRGRLNKALDWMREQDLVPKGYGKLTGSKSKP